MLARSRLLAGHFLRRLFDNDLASPHADAHLGAALGAAMLLSGSTVITFLIGAKYVMDPFPSPARTAMGAVDDLFLYVTASMILLALAAVVAWDGLALDARDEAILGPLPLPRGAIVTAKLAAMLALAGGVTLALNATPTLFHPGAMLAQYPAGLLGGVRLLAAHLAATGAAGVFGFCTVLAIREVGRAIAGPWWPAISTRLQALLLAGLVVALLLMPGWMSRSAERLVPQGGALPRATLASPPMWFIGLHQQIAAEFVVGLTPKNALPRRLQAQEARAMALFRAGQAGNAPLASLALTAAAIAFTTAMAAFLWNARRPAARPRTPARAARHDRVVARAAAALVARTPVIRAGFYFTLRTLSRSPSHRAAVAVGGAVGIAMAVICLGPAGTRADVHVARNVLAAQTLLLAGLLAGAEHAMRLPAHLPAGWLVQLAWPADARPYVVGVKRGIAAGLVLPALAAILVVHVALLGWPRAIAHAIVGGLAALVAIEARALSSHALPFLTPYVAGGRLKLAPFYFGAAVVAAHLLAAIELTALASVRGTLILIGLLAAAAAGLAALGWRRAAPRMDDLDAFQPVLDEATQLRL